MGPGHEDEEMRRMARVLASARSPRANGRTGLRSGRAPNRQHITRSVCEALWLRRCGDCACARAPPAAVLDGCYLIVGMDVCGSAAPQRVEWKGACRDDDKVVSESIMCTMVTDVTAAR